MAATFCLRLAFGLIASMLLLPAGQTPPRFFRVQYLIALGLLAATTFFVGSDADPIFYGRTGTLSLLLISLLVCLAGSIVWHLDGAPAAKWILDLALLVILPILFTSHLIGKEGYETIGWKMLEDVSAAALLGSCTSAMLMGHSYLIAPAMSLTPLLRLLAAMGVSLGVRVALAGFALFDQTGAAAGMNSETMLLLGLRWGLGFAGVLILGWMSWETARIRSTQSATGILYVVVIFCFVGELSGQLLETRGPYNSF